MSTTPKAPLSPRVKLICELCGWIGMILVQCATLPALIYNLMGWSDHLPPLSMVLLIWAGLALYFVRAVAQNDKLYMFSNGFGFCMQSLMLGIFVYG